MPALRHGFLIVCALLALSLTTRAATYYVDDSATGCGGSGCSDSNNGTSKTTAWIHAPGMTGCTATCSSQTINAGDSVILRGGDVWHYEAAAGTVGLPWTWADSGSSTACNPDASAGAITTATCTYLGVDQTWYVGSSWTRPQFDMDNPLTTTRPASCTYDESSVNMMSVTATYTIIDNLEFYGECWNTNSPGTVVNMGGSGNEIKDCYFHGWTYGSSSTDDEFTQIAYRTGGFIRVDHNVFDGSDSSLGTTNGAASGKSLGTGTEIDHNVFWHVSNGYVSSTSSDAHDNLFYYLFEPAGTVHGNIFEMLAQPSSNLYFYNNLSYLSNEGEGYDLYTGPTTPGYIFNNISYWYRVTFSGSTPVNGTDGANCYLMENTGGSGTLTFYFYNNTTDYPCTMNPKNITATPYFQNDHFIGFGTTAAAAIAAFNSVGTPVDNGNEIAQSEAAANAQGYTTSNNYAPTSGGATIAAGFDNASFCSGIPNAEAAAACVEGYGGVTYDQTNHTAVNNTTPARGSIWDAGAYQFSSSGGPTPTAPGAFGGFANLDWMAPAVKSP